MSSDEIDIEEHDVLEDPRLRHLLPNLLPDQHQLQPPDLHPLPLPPEHQPVGGPEDGNYILPDEPDLSRVKTEAPDYEDPPNLGYAPFTAAFHRAGPSVRHHPDSEYTRHHNKIILGSKPSPTQRKTPVNQGFRHDPVLFDKNLRIKEEIDDDFERTRNNFFVLGSKPSKRTHEQANRARIPENAHVVLENWGPKLERSHCYCDDCKILFATRNALDAHKMACHSFLVALDNRAMKSTAKSSKSVENWKSCTQCNKKFPNDSLLLAHVYGHLQSKTKDQNVRRLTIQPKFTNRISLGTKPASFPDSEPNSEDDQENSEGYFRCSVCSHYTDNVKSFYKHNLTNHFIQKPKTLRVEYDKFCPYCPFSHNNLINYNTHIYRSHNNLYIKKTEKAPQPQSSGPDNSISVKFQCTKCGDVFLSYTLARMHRKIEHPDLKSENLIKKIISKNEGKKTNEPSTSKRKAEDNVNDNPKRQKVAKKKLPVYYCEYCKTTFFAKRMIPVHLEKKCDDYYKKNAVGLYICKICGLCHSLSCKHATFHEKNPNLTIHDFEFTRVQDNRIIPAPIPDYHACKRCGVNLLRHIDIQKHECGALYKTCKACKKQFPDDVYTVHMEFHNYVVDEKFEKKQQETPEMPEIIKKYRMLTETWNILYHCKVCDIVTDSYDKAVEHSQKHFNNLENYDVVIKQCKYCQLMFDESCLERHMEIHKDNKTISKDSFRILSYDFDKLLTNEWFELFGNLPKSQIQQIVMRSIYAHCRSVKMTVFLEGTPELTIYQCATCKRYVHPPSLPKHKLTVCVKSFQKHYCGVCHIPFCSSHGKDSHETTHQNRGRYRHVIFNAPEHEKFDNALKSKNEEISQESTSELQKKKKNVYARPLIKHKGKTFKTDEGENRRRLNLYIVYNCTKCKAHVFGKDYADRHSCSLRKGILSRCGVCGLNIHLTKRQFHQQKHEENVNFVRKNMRIVKFTVTTNELGKRTVVYERNTDFRRIACLLKCKCGLHFTSEETYDNHLSVCSPKAAKSGTNCGECGYRFDDIELHRHNGEHHSHDIYLRFSVKEMKPHDSETSNDEDVDVEDNDQESEEVEKPKLYKCGSCKLLFHVKSDIVRHLPVCDPNANKENKCIRCGLSFYSTVLTHMLKVNNCEQLTEDDYDIAILFPRETEMKKTFTKRENYVYKCYKCEVHWMSRHTLSDYHMVTTKHKMTTKVILCPKCGLKFPKQSYKRHWLLHHQKLNLTRNDIHVEVIYEADNTEATNKNLPVPVKHKQPLTWSDLSQKVAAKDQNTSVSNIFHCSKCSIYFLSRRSRYRHFSRGRCGKITPLPCERCNLVFNSEQSLTLHSSIHHDSLNLSSGDYTIIGDDNVKTQAPAQPPQKIIPGRNKYGQIVKKIKAIPKPLLVRNISKVPASFDNIKCSKQLFYCNKCPLKFMTRMALVSHTFTKNHNQDPNKCSTCKYSFTFSSIKKHVYIHHQKMRLQRKDLILVNRNGVPKRYEGSLSSDEHDETMENDESMEQDETMEDNVGTMEEHDESMDDLVDYKKPQRIKIENYTSSRRNVVYKCKLCLLHFISRAARRQHMSRDTNQHNNMGLSCPVCSLTFSNFSLKTHIFIHHRTMKLGRKDILVLDENVSDEPRPIQFKPNTSTQQINSEVMKPSTSTQQQNSATPWENNLASYVDTTHYDSKIYKCQTCSHHFITYKGYHSHKHSGKSCSDATDIKPCRFCGLRFGVRTLKKHIYIHHDQMKLRRKDFLIMNVQEYVQPSNSQRSETPIQKKPTPMSGKPIEMLQKPAQIRRSHYKLTDDAKAQMDELPFSNYLYKCRNCGMHFIMKNTRASHMLRYCHDNPPIAKCSVCDLTFSPKTLERHIYFHHQKHKLQLEDLIIVNDLDTPTEVPNEWKEKPKKSLKLSEKFKAELDLSQYDNKLYKCTRCARHFINLINRKSHEKKCIMKRATGETDGCGICGILFNVTTLAKHVYIHHEMMNLQFAEDFDIIDTLKVATPKISSNSYEFDGTYSKTLPSRRTDGSESKSGINLRKRVVYESDSSFDMSRASSTQNLTSDLDKVDGSASEREDFSETYPCLSAKVLRTIDISNYNNTLYRCHVCQAHFLILESLQKHLTMSHIYTLLNCEICGHGFAPPALLRHKYIHHERLGFKKEDINIVTSENLARTLFKCPICSVHSMSGLKNHVCPTRNMEQCIICDLHFSSKALNNHYERHHKKMKLSLDDFIIIESLDGKIDESKLSTKTGTDASELDSLADIKIEQDEASTFDEINPELITETSEHETKDQNDEPPNLELSTLNPDLYDNKLFKCNACSLYFIDKQNFEWHMKKSDHISVVKIHCTICGLAFSAQTIPTHTFIHHEKLKLGVKDFVVTSSGADKDSGPNKDSPNKVINKDSGPNKDSQNKGINKDSGSSKDNQNKAINKQGDSKKDSASRICNKDKDTSRKNSDPDKGLIEDKPIKDIKANSPSISNKSLNSTDDSVVCQSSDESYAEKSASNSPQIQIKQTPTTTSSIEVCATKKYTTKLYKCSECNVYYLSQSSCYKHTYKNHTPLDPFDYIACKICGLQFGNMTLPKHVIQHHKNKEFNLEQVLVEEYLPRKETGAPKIEIYVAIDRVQSKLVSTTCEKEIPESSTGNEDKASEIPESTTATTSERGAMEVETTSSKVDTVINSLDTSKGKVSETSGETAQQKPNEDTETNVESVSMDVDTTLENLYFVTETVEDAEETDKAARQKGELKSLETSFVESNEIFDVDKADHVEDTAMTVVPTQQTELTTEKIVETAVNVDSSEDFVDRIKIIDIKSEMEINDCVASSIDTSGPQKWKSESADLTKNPTVRNDIDDTVTDGATTNLVQATEAMGKGPNSHLIEEPTEKTSKITENIGEVRETLKHSDEVTEVSEKIEEVTKTIEEPTKTEQATEIIDAAMKVEPTENIGVGDMKEVSEMIGELSKMLEAPDTTIVTKPDTQHEKVAKTIEATKSVEPIKDSVTLEDPSKHLEATETKEVNKNIEETVQDTVEATKSVEHTKDSVTLGDRSKHLKRTETKEVIKSIEETVQDTEATELSEVTEMIDELTKMLEPSEAKKDNDSVGEP